MKKYLSIFIAFVLLFSIAACSSGVHKQNGVGVAADIREYAVISNGGSAVQYGEYIYFINGTRGFEDSGDENVMGKVVKGGLYRTTLINPSSAFGSGKIARQYDFHYGSVDLNVFVPSYDLTSHLQFESESYNVDIYQRDANDQFVLDDDGEKIVIHQETEYAPKAEMVVGKTIGTSGYKDGGIFIFDNFIFFASPSDNVSRSGNVEVNKTQFFVSTLSGSEVRRVYTSENDTQSKAYAFYKYGGSYYLVVHDGSNIVSVRIGSDGKAKETKTIAENVTSVLFPKKDIYYNFSKNGTTYSTPEHTAEDFIYYTRNATKNDVITKGEVMEMVRPNGSQGLIVNNDGFAVTLHNTSNGLVFYSTNDISSGKAVRYSNFHNLLMEKNSEYKNAHFAYAASGSNISIVNNVGSFAINSGDFTSVVGVNPNSNSLGDVHLLTFGSTLNRHSLNGSTTLFNGSASFAKLTRNRLYIVANEALQYVDLYSGGSTVTIISDANTYVYTYDILDEYLVYLSDEDDLLKNCAKFKRIDDESVSGIFIGQRTSSEEADD